jgi:hypothetical protein
MTMAARTEGTVVSLARPAHAHPAPALPNATPITRLLAWSESWADEPLPHLPDIPPDLVAALPVAVAQARRDLTPGDPGEILAGLTTLASRRGLPLPDGIALEMDVEVMAAWPRDLWHKAFTGIWERFAYRRMPEVADFRRVIEADLAERKARLDRLESFRLKLETIRMRKMWDEETVRKNRQREQNTRS